jgi:phenylalanyl-tRNA synthetase beta chain
VAAITGRKLKVPSLRHCEGTKCPKQSLKAGLLRRASPYSQRQIVVKVDDKKLCPRYTARIIYNVKVGESPGWLKKRIEAMGLRPVNNIVDITNFCLFETGEPMHAFDLDKLSGRSIVVRRAAKNEKIKAIDGTERALEESMLVIADSDRPVAVAGVMGGSNTEVGSSTANILLEAAYFDPVSVRRTSRRLALPTESSYRFERKVDMDNIADASLRAANLILEIAGGERGEFIDVGNRKKYKRKISLRFEQLDKITGVSIAPSRTKAILTSLGLKLNSATKAAASFTIPPFRQDLQDEIDLVEEVARIYGYDNIPQTLPQVVEHGLRAPFDVVVDDKMRDVLTKMGLFEIITYGLISKSSLNSAMIDSADAVEIKNALSVEQEVMRPSSIAGMLKSIRYNMNRKSGSLRFFELGKVYLKDGVNTFRENRNLSIGITGRVDDDWMGQGRSASFYDLKGIIKTLFLELGVGSFDMRDAANGTLSSAVSSSIEVRGEPMGIIGEVDAKVLNNFDIKDKVYIAEIDCEALLKFISLEKRFQEIPRYPSISRDISVVVGKDILNAQIMSSIKDTAGAILKDVRLIDRYRGGQIPDGKISLTYRLEYQDPKRTLEDKDVQDAHSRVVRALENNLAARLR